MPKQRKRRTSRTVQRSTRPSQQWRWLALAGALVVVVAGLVFWGFQGESDSPAITGDALPTPIGFPETAQDVGTMEGEPAPAFALQDETGQLVTVDPAASEQPTVLVFNMGLG